LKPEIVYIEISLEIQNRSYRNIVGNRKSFASKYIIGIEIRSCHNIVGNRNSCISFVNVQSWILCLKAPTVTEQWKCSCKGG
jgi:hypothetical protein